MRELYTVRSAVAEQSSRTRLEEIDHMSETTKAAAWAVFQHHGGGGAAGTSSYSRGFSAGIAVRRATRFKIEAQMKSGGAHSEGRASTALCSSTASCNQLWDAGSTLFDSYELHSLSKQFDQALILSFPGTCSSRFSSLEEVPARGSPAEKLQDRMRDFVEDSYTLEPAAHGFFMRPAAASSGNIVENNAVAASRADELPTVDDGKSPAGGTAAISSYIEKKKLESLQLPELDNSTEEAEETIDKLGDHQKDLDDGPGMISFRQLQFGHTPNPLNLSQRKLSRRGSMDDDKNSNRSRSSHDDDDEDVYGPSAIASRQSFQEKLRKFFHKARISPQLDSSSMQQHNHHHGNKTRTGRMFHYGWSYVESDARVTASCSDGNRKLSKHKKKSGSSSFSRLRSVTKALRQSSLPYLGGGGGGGGGGSSSSSFAESTSSRDYYRCEKQLHPSKSSADHHVIAELHEHHHVYYHHHHHHIVIHQQQDLLHLDQDCNELMSLQEEEEDVMIMGHHNSLQRVVTTSDPTNLLSLEENIKASSWISESSFHEKTSDAITSTLSIMSNNFKFSPRSKNPHLVDTLESEESSREPDQHHNFCLSDHSDKQQQHQQQQQ